MTDQQTTLPAGAYVEVECSHCQADFDLEVMDADARWSCPSCGAEHRVGDIGQLCIPGAGGSMWLSEWRLTRGEPGGIVADLGDVWRGDNAKA